jgi:HK97 family phage major capsid protein
VIALDAALKQRLVRDVAAKLDTQFYSATGDGVTTPKGMLAWTGIQAFSGSSAGINYDLLLDAWGKALNADVSMSGLRWFLHPRTFVAMKKIKELASGGNAYLVTQDVTGDAVYRAWGSPIVVTKRMSLTEVVLADMSQVAVARDLAPSVTVLKERYADYDQQALRVVARYDVAPLNPQAVVRLHTLATPA